MKKIGIFIFAIMCAGTMSAHAKIVEVTATGTGGSEYAATMDAIDNAVRQTSKVDVANKDGADLSETHIVGKDDRSISVKASSKQKTSFFSRVKGWFGGGGEDSSATASASSESEYRYEQKGGDVEYHDTSVKRKIDMKYAGAIDSYEVLESKEKKGTHTVKIKAKIKQLDDYVSPDLVKKAEYTVAIVPADEGKKFACVGGKRSGKDIEEKAISKISNKLVASKKLSVVDRDNLSKILKEFGLLEKDIANPDNANKLKQVKIADYLLVVKTESFEATTTVKNIELTGEKISNTSGNLEMTWRLIETGTMEIVASGSESETYGAKGGGSCDGIASTLAKGAGTEIADSVLREIR